MSTMTSDMIRARPVTTAALAIALVGAATILGAWFFQYGLGLKPCPLCLEQRYAYYFAIPLAVMVALGDQFGASRKVLMAALIAIAPACCGTPGSASTIRASNGAGGRVRRNARAPATSSVRPAASSSSSQSIRVVRCDEAAWRFLGLSLAGYNVIISLALAAIAAYAAAKVEWQARAERRAHEHAAIDGAGGVCPACSVHVYGTRASPSAVAIHPLRELLRRRWMRGSSPRMTTRGVGCIFPTTIRR